MVDSRSDARMLARLAAAAGLLAVALAGCSGAPAARDLLDDGAGLPEGSALDAAPTATAPTWSVGQYWDHRWYFGPQDTTGFVVKAIVVENGSTGYRLATDEAVDAASHASFYFHDQGT